MSSMQPSFDVKLDFSSDDDPIFITQEPSQVKILDESKSDIDLEGLLESSKDSAIDVENLNENESATNTKHVPMSGDAESNGQKYSVECEDISDSEERCVLKFKFWHLIILPVIYWFEITRKLVTCQSITLFV